MQAPQDAKPIPPMDLSLKYMAWDVKQISKSLVELVQAVDRLTQAVTNKKRQDEVPF